MPILEVGDDGMLHVPAEFLAGAQPHAQFEIERMGPVTLLRPASSTAAARASTPAERAAAFQAWVDSFHPPAPDLPAESLRRESIYDD